ncbi:hypothetical protein [Metasolibacillus fluoroglycofenilyticus]|uniref:hypothetical protein n=1 Tax=Metasolibacillus fluoroglycofenilyticus TaxID=1239396 RepID=UPI000D3AB431|nr:hypothetical protein [Metasolibacillus fluoroglycofenilyticus]
MFTNEQLKQFIKGKVLGEMFPYDTGDEHLIISYLKRIKAELEKSLPVRCEVEPLHFGSGYASYMQWFVYKTDMLTRKEREKDVMEEEREGLIVNISMLAPVVLIGKGEKSTCYVKGEWHSGAMTSLAEPQQLLIPPHLKELYENLQRLFMKYNYGILYREDVEKQLPFKANIAITFREPKDYLVWDAIFYWMD